MSFFSETANMVERNGRRVLANFPLLMDKQTFFISLLEGWNKANTSIFSIGLIEEEKQYR